MNDSDRTLLRAIFMIVVSIGLILMADITSGGHGTNESAILYWAGIILFITGVCAGILGLVTKSSDSRPRNGDKQDDAANDNK